MKSRILSSMLWACIGMGLSMTDLQAQDEFITTWITTSDSLVIPINTSLTYNYDVSWINLTNPGVGDGLSPGGLPVLDDFVISGLETGSLYQVSITGTFPGIQMGRFPDEAIKLQSIEQWGTILWESMNDAFKGCSNMIYNATDIPDLSDVIDMSGMFSGALLFNGNINSWEVSTVENMEELFAGQSNSEKNIFNQPLDQWDVSNVTNFNSMFLYNLNFDQDLSAWDVSSATTMRRMFEESESFNNGGVPLTWGAATANVTDMWRMFLRASSFNQDVTSWDVSKVTNMAAMFASTPFSQDISSWNISSLKSMDSMFSDCTDFNRPIGVWSTDSCTNMTSVFRGATSFNQDLTGWNTSMVTQMDGMFEDASSFNQPIGSWDVSKVTDMENMFNSAIAFNQDLSGWSVDSVSNMQEMFRGAISFNSDLSAWNVGNVNTMHGMFNSASVFNQDISTWDVSSVEDMSSMFSSAFTFNQDLTDWNTSSVLDMTGMFSNAGSFNGDLSLWNVSAVTSFHSMFAGATVFNTDISDWNTASATAMESMFQNADSFNIDISRWNISGVTNLRAMFAGAFSFNQDISNWDVSQMINLNLLFDDAPSFNQDISGWDVSSALNMNRMFRNAVSFDQNLGSWDMSSVGDVEFMLSNSGLSVSNYDSTLIGWAGRLLQDSLTLGADGLQYSQDALIARTTLTSAPLLWTITGDDLFLPAISITSPESGDVFSSGDSLEITWIQEDILDEDLLEIYISPDSSLTNFLLADGPSNFFNGTYKWFIPDTLTGDAFQIQLVHPISQQSDTSDGVFIIENLVPYRIVEQDSLAMVLLFDSLNGSNWSGVSNWLSAPILEWEGLSFNDDSTRITAVDLSGVGAEGAFPVFNELFDSGGLLQLTEIDLSDNNLTEIIDLNATGQLAMLDVSGNLLGTNELLKNVGLPAYTYAPQQLLGTSLSDTLPAGTDLTLTYDINSADTTNTYVWFFNDEVIFGADQYSYTIAHLGFDQMGTYYLTISNSNLPGLVLETVPSTILASADISGTIEVSDGSALPGGKVEIFRITNGPYIIADSSEVDNSGAYLFTDILLDNYILNVKPNRASSGNDVLQTYYVSTDNWQEADTLRLRFDSLSLDISMVTYDPPTIDPRGADFEGSLFTDFEDDAARTLARRKVQRAGCSLRRFVGSGRTDQEGEYELFAYVESDDDGNFNFPGIPAGSYRLNIEYPGVPMDENSDIFFEVSADKANQLFQLTALVTEDGIKVEAFEVLFVNKSYLDDLAVYPNPTDGLVQVDYRINRKVNNLQLQIHDIRGVEIMTKSLKTQLGAYALHMDLSALEEGVYIFTFSDSAGTFRREVKVQKKK